VHTSLLRRAIDTAEIVIAETNATNAPCNRSCASTKRHYGRLQGRPAPRCREEFVPPCQRVPGVPTTLVSAITISAVSMARRSSEVCTAAGCRPASRINPPARAGLLTTARGEVEIEPASEPVVGIGGALTVPQQDEVDHVSASPRSSAAI